MANQSLEELLENFTETKKPATEKQIAAFVKKIGFAPPPDFLEFVSKSNGGCFGEPAMLKTIYNLTTALKTTKEYEFEEVAPKIIAIGTEGAGTAYCLDGRYEPARIIETDYAMPGELGDSTDFGTSFVGFLEQLMNPKRELKKGLPPLPEAAPAKKFTSIPLEEDTYLALGLDQKSFWLTKKGTERRLISIPDGRELDRAPDPGTAWYELTAHGSPIYSCGNPDGTYSTYVVGADGESVIFGEGFFRGLTSNRTAAVLQFRGEEIRIVDLQSKEIKYQYPIDAQSKVSPDGRWLIKFYEETRQLQLTELATSKIAWTTKISGKDWVTNFVFSDDPQTLWAKNGESKVICVDLQTGKIKFKCGDRAHPANGHGDPVGIPGTANLITSNRDCTQLVVWSGTTGEIKAEHRVNAVKDGFIGQFAATLDGKYVVFTCRNLKQGKLIVWEL
jgi:hypothetical protein